MMDYEKSPCLHCTRCAKPEECNNKLCGAWQVWFLSSWEKIHKPEAAGGIGQRMDREVKRVCEARGLRLEQFAPYSTQLCWRRNRAPSADALAKLHELGGDVIWVLTGKRGARR